MVRKLIFTICFLTFACAPTPTATTLPAAAADLELDAAIQQARDSLNTPSTVRISESEPVTES